MTINSFRPNQRSLSFYAVFLSSFCFSGFIAADEFSSDSEELSEFDSETEEDSEFESEFDTEWNFDLALTLLRNDNIGRAQKERDIISDNSAKFFLSAGYDIDFGLSRIYTLSTFVEKESFEVIKGMEHTTVGASINYQWQPDIEEPDTASYQLNLSVQDDDFTSDQRDSTTSIAILSVSKPISDNISLSAGYEYRQRDSESNVFDLNTQQVFLSADYFINQDWTLYAAYNQTEGPTWSTVQSEFCNGVVATDIYPIVSWSNELEFDQAFNDSLCGNWVTYQLDATTQTLTAGVNWFMSDTFSLDFSTTQVEVDASGSNEYSSKVYTLVLSARF